MTNIERHKDDVVHLLHRGFPGCDFTARAPDAWPPGHSWTDVSSKELVTCPGCVEYMARQLNWVKRDYLMSITERSEKRKLQRQRREHRRGFEYALGRIIIDKASAIELQAEYSPIYKSPFDAGIIDAVDACIRLNIIEDDRV